MFALAYLLFPVLVVVVISFSSVGYLRFPPPGLSLRWYAKLLDTPAWMEAFWVTLQVGGLTTAFATVLGVPAAFALIRLRLRGKAVLNALLLMALITPSIIKGLATYLFFVPYGLGTGSPDLVGILAPQGTWFTLEVKCVGEKPTDEQLHVHALGCAIPRRPAGAGRGG